MVLFEEEPVLGFSPRFVDGCLLSVSLYVIFLLWVSVSASRYDPLRKHSHMDHKLPYSNMTSS